MLRCSLFALLVALVSNIAAVAQGTAQLSIEPGELTSGQSAEVKYVDSAQAGKTITVTITDVPSWPIALFSAPDVPDQAHLIN